MTFLSAAFAVFFPITLIFYYTLPKKCQWVILLAASTVFYLFSGPKYFIYVLATAGVTYGCALWVKSMADKFAADLPELKKTLPKDELQKAVKKAESARGKVVFLALAVDLGILIVLKYLDFLIGNINSVFSLSGDSALPTFSFVMPLGLSFYTFAAVGYIVDVSRGKYSPEKNPAKFVLFLTFFPQIFQGPIPRFERLAPQFSAEHRFDYDNFRGGLQLALWGTFKKVVIADAVGGIVYRTVTNYSDMSGIRLWLGMFVWGIQLYTDFSGGIDMTRGVAECFGIHLDENFKRPYFATDLTDYWNRWHITLSDWLRDYFFYPIALSKRFARFSKSLKKKFGKFIAKTVPVGLLSLALFTLVGIWHGANWGEVLFGVFNGVVILITTLMEPLFEKPRKILKMDSSVGWHIFRSVRTFLLITIARVISKAPSIPDACRMLGKMFFKPDFAGFFGSFGSDFSFTESILPYLPALAGCVLLFFVSLTEERGHHVRDLINERPAPLRIAAEVMCVAYIIVFGAYGLGYDASNFIYTNY
ncbi:MAG: hypothetical protein MJ102_03960 [Clostridia bacterium]|nr:hypothetical protein [Clostridia bacterium]